MKRNVALIVLDTVRKDYFDEFAPQLQDLSDVSFKQSRAASSWSVPSHGSILTGELPHVHGAHADDPGFSSIPQESTFLAGLQQHHKICVSANVWASSIFEFTKHFDEYTDVSPRQRFRKGKHMKEFNMWYDSGSKIPKFLEYSLKQDHPLWTLLNGFYSKTQAKIKQLPIPSPYDDGANAVIDNSLSYIEDNEEPIFLFNNFMDAHGPAHHMLGYNKNKHSVPLSWNGHDFDYWDINLNKPSNKEKDIENYRELYGASIDYLDKKVSLFVDELQNKTNRETTVIITADHGENLGYSEDEGLFNHVSSLSESLLHVPLYIINPPEGYSSEEAGYFSHLDLGTLIKRLATNETPDLFNDSIPAELIGGNLATRNNVPDEELDYWDRMQRCVYDGEYRIVWDSLDNTDCYKIDFERPCWQNKIQSGHTVPESAKDLFSESITSFKDQLENGSEIIESSARERLDDLGYL